ncbi:RDD family protein [Candidatus Stoquefichus massiliensis]|uniref:RDD family protein n=1 Tax=Candidatus Stoquefichus massiliensis TaxID=1470350 RepID=UPI0004810D2B|nr:RDD family protein [Candidatus Stoquefichus massiliensis]
MKKHVSLLKRGIAFFVDLYIGALLATLPISVITFFKLHQITQNIFLLDKPTAIIAVLLSLICLYFYYIYIPTSIYLGQTLGKRLMDIQIIAKSHRLFMKRQIIFMGIFTSTSKVLAQLVSLLIGYNIVSLVTDITLSLSFIAIMSLFFTKQMLHDRLAKTDIIDITNPKVIIQNELREEK